MERQLAAVIAILVGIGLAYAKDEVHIEQIGVAEPALVDGFDDVFLDDVPSPAVAARHADGT